MFTAYDNPGREGEPLWTREGTWCRDSEIALSLKPGERQAFPRTNLDFDEITKNRGPGTYYFSARLWASLGDRSSEYVTEPIPAGAVVLLP
jgi:hypothetical protein